MMGNPISVVFGAPLSTAVLGIHPYLGLRGWQWLFLLEGLPAVVLAQLGHRSLLIAIGRAARTRCHGTKHSCIDAPVSVALRRFQRLDVAFNFGRELVLCNFQVVAGLEIHPENGCVIEVAGQP